jgi:hypothetical protein
MSVAATDIVVYASLNMPDTDSGVNGGAIDVLRRLAFTQIAANDTIQAVSASAADTTQTITVEGRSAAGAVVSSGAVTLTGTTAVNLPALGTVERVLKADLSATCAGIVTVRRTTGAVQIGQIPVGERGFMAPFRKTASDPSVPKTYYVKGFVKNNHATLALLSATIKQNADVSNVITHAVALAVNDSVQAADRLTAPATITFDDADKSIGDLNALAAWGVWLKLSLTAGQGALKSLYVLEAAGQST